MTATEEVTALTPEQWQKAEDILTEILELPADQRQAALDRACQGDEGLRRELESLLAAADPAESFIETPVFSLRSEGLLEIREGQRVGSYQIERLLGRGGMGSVFLATRIDEFEKRVALKILKPGLNTEAIVRRFRHERQILAHLDHPNIAKLLDGGSTEEGLPYFVMEYVEGEPIDHYCDRQRLTIRQRLTLFRKVCSAVHLAHQNLIVHRDLKPANILVGADGEPKLLDFGIAKPLDPEDASTLLTASGAQPMTLAYASPEQVEGEAITTASDIYTLGVLLYELLSGRRPYRTPSRKWLDLARAIREEQPEKPCTAVGRKPTEPRSTTSERRQTMTFNHDSQQETLARGTRSSEPQSSEPRSSQPHSSDLPPAKEVLTTEELSHRRSTDPRGLRRRLTGDLDSIVLMALRKEVSRRYSTVEQFSQDIDRFLTGLPVVARPATLAYQAGKFVRRHTLESALVALLLLTIIGFGVVSLRMRDRAVLERERAEEVTGFLVSLFEGSNPDAAKGEDVTAMEILDRGRQQIEIYRENEPRLYAMLAATMGDVYYNLGLFEKARPMLEEALPGLQRHVGGADDRQLATVFNDLAAILWGQGDSQRAEALFRQALEMKIRLYGDNDPRIVTNLNNLAVATKQHGDLETAEDLYRRGIKIRSSQDPPVPEALAYSLSSLGTLLLDKEDYDQALDHLNRALEIRQGLFGVEHTSVALVLNNLGLVHQALEATTEAEDMYREALRIRRKLLGDAHSDVAITEINLASVLVDQNQAPEATVLATRALASLRQSKPGHWRVAHAESVLGSSLALSGNFPQAEALMNASYPIREAPHDDCSKYNRDALHRLAGLYEAWGNSAAELKYKSMLEACPARRQPV